MTDPLKINPSMSQKIKKISGEKLMLAPGAFFFYHSRRKMS